jgi:AcrR family transcriptional regulator
MPSTSSRSSGTVDPPVKARRLTAQARRRSILKAARRAFSETGDVNGTTIKIIAQHSQISEGVIYRHFESKEQLFFEAVVEPLQEAVDDLVTAAEQIDRDEPLTPERQIQTLNGLYRQLISTLKEVLPLVGLVLFGDPQVARRFYKEDYAVAMDRLGEAWSQVETRYGDQLESPLITSRAVMGIAWSLALESYYNKQFDLDEAVEIASHGTLKGFFPPIRANSRRR